MKTSKFLFFAITALVVFGCTAKKQSPPNILFCISDDQSFPHAGAYGCDWVKTPAFDRIAKEGLLFTNAYTCNAKCAPSRAAILTGRNSWQLEEAASHVGYFPNKFKTVFETLNEAGYQTGRTAKGWAPGIVRKVNGIPRELIGKNYSSIKTTPPAKGMSNIDYTANFSAFLDDTPKDKPFAFWYGGIEPHRVYEYQSGIQKGAKKLSDISKVPGYWMDNEVVRTDMLDYAFEIEYFDKHLEGMLDALEERGMLENTLIVVTSDNGMPFPRCKAQEYPSSCHMPLAIMWADGIKKTGRTITDFVSNIDFSATFLDVAGINQETSGMESITGKSLVPIFQSEKNGRVEESRNFVLVGKERHDTGRPNDWGYPIRGIISDNFIYLKNFKPDRWPTGQPETGYLDCDGSPTKTEILDAFNTDNHKLWEFSFGKREADEFYDLEKDPDCVNNIASDIGSDAKRDYWSTLLMEKLNEQADPRVLGNGDMFDNLKIMPSQINFYERYFGGEKMGHGWVNDSDFRPEQNPETTMILQSKK
jgi:arylsulfatase A-like enzyme